MPQYSYQKPEQRFEQVRTSDVDQAVRTSFLWMTIGLLITAAVSWLFAASGLLLTFVYNPMISLILAVVQIGLCVAFTMRLQKSSLTEMKGMFIAFSITMGISLSSLCYTYSQTTLAAAFLVSALYFGCTAFIGYTTKMDLTRIGSLASIGLIVLIISQIVLMFFHASWSVRLYCIVGLVIFTGLTAWDIQRLNQTMLSCQGQPVVQKKWAIYFALQLYLDFINVFLYILRLLGAGNSRSRS